MVQGYKLDVDVDAIVKESVKRDRNSLLHTVTGEKTIDEAYVAQPKVYRQVTELVSEKAKNAHTALYQDYVEALNRVSAELDTADRDGANANHSKFADLKKDEARLLNACWLHELYFANAFQVHSEITMDSLAYIELERTFGTFDDAQKDMIACAMSAGEGWLVCGYNMFLKRIVNTVINDHSQNVMVGLYPLIVIDMWGHSYFRDYLTDKRSYLVGRMRELDWDVINERFAKCKQIAEVMK